MAMGTTMRLLSALIAVFVFNAFVMPAGAWAQEAAVAEGKITTVDPQFVPLSEPKSIEKPGLKWYWYLVGLAVIGGAIAAAGSGGGGSGSSAPSSGAVTGTW
jgi:ABC-type cobalt transport system substrate-binding protein